MTGRPRRLDLTDDGSNIISLVTTGIAKFAASPEAKKALPITLIYLEYDLTSMQYPAVWLEVDTEPNGEPHTGSSQTYRLADRDFKRWAGPCHAVLDGEKTLVVTPKDSTLVHDEESLCRAVGLHLVDLVKTMRKGGVFKKLRRAEQCYLIVSTYDGVWSWPEWEDRGKENLV